MFLSLIQVLWEIGLLSFGYMSEFHHTVSAVLVSFTMYLSLGDLPVNLPVNTLGQLKFVLYVRS